MWYENDANFMKQMVRYTVPNANVKKNRMAVKHLYSFQPAPQILPEIVLYYPGYKDAIGDYKLTFSEKELKHSDICQIIYNYCVVNGTLLMTCLLKGLYENGLDANLDGSFFDININDKIFNYEQFKTLIYWLTLQEEINYPISKQNMSVKLPFTRYLEAVVVAYCFPYLESIEQIKHRADSKKPFKFLEELPQPQIDIPRQMLEFSEVLK